MNDIHKAAKLANNGFGALGLDLFNGRDDGGLIDIFLAEIFKIFPTASLSSQITLHRDNNRRVTRAVSSLHAVVPRLNLETSRRAFRYWGPWYGNLIDDSIRDADTVNSFKRRLYKLDTFAPI